MIKVSNFYHTYDADGLLLHYLFHYKIRNKMVGFSVQSLKKVLSKLSHEKIGYYIDKDIFRSFHDNQYQIILDKSKLYLELERDIDDIYQFLTDNIERKFIKKIIKNICEVIDEG